MARRKPSTPHRRCRSALARGGGGLPHPLDLFLGEPVDGGSLLLHAPSHDASVLSLLDDLGHRPDGSGLAHVESSRRLGVGRELVGVEDSTGSHQAGVSVLLEPLGSDGGTGLLHGLGFQPGSLGTGLGGLALLDGLLLLRLPGGVVGGGRETDGLPDRGHLGGSQEGLSDEGEVDGDAGEVQEAPDLVGFLRGAVHSEAEAVLVEAFLEGGLGDDLLSPPEVFEADSGVLQQTEIFHLHGVPVDTRRSLHGNSLLSEATDGASAGLLVCGSTADRKKNSCCGNLHGE
mmetsp:Transcript_107168/g.218657  ORF Transcript_107168/g.218657 Transcript_107168/m.218657 type:complete len:288 (-) Transcript_107168:67-930(-)